MTAWRCCAAAAAILACVAAPGAASETGPSCAPPARLMQWPSPQDPAWAFCYLTPKDSSGASGSGLEIRDAYYNGHPAFRRAHAPVVNVFYEGGCGCWRGSSGTEAPFGVVAARGPVSGPPGSEADALVPPRTSCDTRGAEDAGAFSGVAVERLSDRVILTTEMAAAWQRYVMRFGFRRDGSIEADFAFASTGSSCDFHGHTHQVYWRFDFGVPGLGPASRPAREETGLLGAGRKLPLGVLDGTTGRGYVLIPGPEALASPADAWSVGDVWLLKHGPGEIGDAGGGCRIDFTGLLNGEPVSDGEAVIWYRAGVHHPGGGFEDCERVGPSLQPVGDWSRARK